MDEHREGGMIIGHQGLARCGMEGFEGDAPDPRVRFDETDLVRQDERIDITVESVPGKAFADVPADVADDADANTAVTQCGQGGDGVGVRLDCFGVSRAGPTPAPGQPQESVPAR